MGDLPNTPTFGRSFANVWKLDTIPGHDCLIETTILAGALGVHQTAFALRDRMPKLLCRFNPFLDNDLYVGKSLLVCPAVRRATVCLAVDREVVQMHVAPPEHDLQRGMEHGQGHVATDERFNWERPDALGLPLL